MEINKLRKGSLIKISPRENEEGLLQIDEIQKDNIIGEMLVPRQGYHFRIKYYEIIPIPLTESWLTKAGFIQDESDVKLWKDPQHLMDFYLDQQDDNKFIQNGSLVGLTSTEFVHDFQNGYLFLTGKELKFTV